MISSSGGRRSGKRRSVWVEPLEPRQLFAASLVTAAQAPYHGTPFVVPTSGSVTIQAEDFDTGGEGVAYHDVDATNNGGKYRTSEGVDIESTSDGGAGGYNVGWTRAGEWLEYTIHVNAAQRYNLAFRVASAGSNATFHAEIDGSDLTGTLTMPNTGAAQNWKTVTKTAVPLAAGDHVLRLKMDANGTNGAIGNFNYVQISQGVVPPPARIVPTSTTAYVQDGASANTNFGSAVQLWLSA